MDIHFRTLFCNSNNNGTQHKSCVFFTFVANKGHSSPLFVIILQTIGFGDMPMPKAHTHLFLCLYIIVSAGLVAYLFGNLHMLKAAINLLNEDEARAKRRLSMEYMIQMDKGAGVTQSEFVLAILEQQGIIDFERDILPWQQVTVTYKSHFSLSTKRLILTNLLRHFLKEI